MVGPRRIALVLAGLLVGSAPAAADVRPCGPLAAGTRALWALADVDGDRDVDLVRVSVAGATSRPMVMPGTCAPAAASSPAAAGGTLTVRDVDTDRDLDLVQVDAAGTPVRTWLNDGRGHFEPAAPTVRGAEARSSSMAMANGSLPPGMAGALPSGTRAATGLAPADVAARPTEGTGAPGIASASIPTVVVFARSAARAPPATPPYRSVTS